MEYDYSKLGGFGKDVYIDNDCNIKRPELFKVGDHIAIDKYFYCTTEAKLDNFIHIGPFVSIVGGKSVKIKLGSFTTLAAGVRIICASEKLMGEGLAGYGIPKEFSDEINYGDVIIEDFVSVATNCVILPGIKLGEGSVIGAGSIVTKNTEPWTVYVGSPAIPIKKRPKEKMKEYAEKLKNYKL